MGCHGPHLLQGELDASRPYLGGCRLKPLDHKDEGVCPIFTLALPLTPGEYPPNNIGKRAVVSSKCSTPVRAGPTYRITGRLDAATGRRDDRAARRRDRQ
ncbi:hypothetical protein GKQ77_22855 [Streptomyces sp. BG9H]|uniref:Uncharacterized protein n=1 Tax=Streptomyces anatolicus TaxID=2675858 RepID=A0ABS6YSN5_9ACTN|nr:hypothetical protein [Streptomyces anatolicus]